MDECQDIKEVKATVAEKHVSFQDVQSKNKTILKKKKKIKKSVSSSSDESFEKEVGKLFDIQNLLVLSTLLKKSIFSCEFEYSGKFQKTMKHVILSVKALKV